MIGNYNDAPNINPDEVASYKWMTAQDIKTDMEEQPETYTEWFKIIFEKYYSHIS
jgi:isopentenyl-diphosphate delta-isomerase